MGRTEIRKLIEEGFDGRAWHGANLTRAIAGVGAADAACRPAAGGHCIWEEVLHCAYWKHRVAARVSGSASRFPRRGRDWPALPAVIDESAWSADRELLVAVHGQLLEVVNRRPLRDTARWTAEQQLTGIAMHDVYHAGQIRLLRVLLGL